MVVKDSIKLPCLRISDNLFMVNERTSSTDGFSLQSTTDLMV